MRALLLPFLFALLAAIPVRAFAADPNDGVRQFVNGQWQLRFEESGTGQDGKPYKIGTLLTITLRYDGTRTIAQDQIYNDDPPMRLTESTDYYRVDDIDGTKFTLTTWADGTPPSATVRTRTGDDTMTVEGSDAIYRRLPNTQEGLLGPMPPQREAPGAAPPPAPSAEPVPPPPPPPVASTQDAQDAAMRAFIIGTWITSIPSGADTLEAKIDYRPGGSVVGMQRVFNGDAPSKSALNITGAYTITATGEKSFTLTLYLSGAQPVTAAFEIVDQNTIFNAKDNYQSRRAP